MTYSRNFAQGTGEGIGLSLGAVPTDITDGPMTVAVVFRRGTVNNGRGMLLHGGDATDDHVFGVWVSSSDRLYVNVGDTWVFNTSAVPTSTSDWYIGGFTWSGSGTLLRHHMGNLDTSTWGHANTTVSASAKTLAKLSLGRAANGGSNFDGDIAAAVVIPAELSDSQFEALASGIQAMLDAGAVGAWLLDQSDPATWVSDLTEGWADQVDISGTSAVAATPTGFSYTHDVILAPAAAVLCHRASSLTLTDNDPVATWADESGNGRDLTQVTGSKQPVYEAAGFNGRPCLYFDGVDDVLRTAAFSPAVDQPTTLVQIMEFESPLPGTGTQYLFAGLASTNRQVLLIDANRSNRWRMYAGSSTTDMGTTAPPAGTPMLVQAVFASTSRLFVDNVQINSTTGIGSYSNAGIGIGARYSDDQGWLKGRVAEIRGYDRELTTEERTNLMAYYEATYLDEGEINASGAITAPAATMAGTGTVAVSGFGEVAAAAAVLAGDAAVEVSGAGDMASPAARLSGSGSLVLESLSASGAITAAAARLSGTATARVSGSGALLSGPAALSGAAQALVSGAGVMASPAAVLLGALAVTPEDADIDPDATPAGRILRSGELAGDLALAQVAALAAEVAILQTALADLQTELDAQPGWNYITSGREQSVASVAIDATGGAKFAPGTFSMFRLHLWNDLDAVGYILLRVNDDSTQDYRTGSIVHDADDALDDTHHAGDNSGFRIGHGSTVDRGTVLCTIMAPGSEQALSYQSTSTRHSDNSTSHRFSHHWGSAGSKGTIETFNLYPVSPVTEFVNIFYYLEGFRTP